MGNKLSCFVIAPIGETGSKIRQDSDDLLGLIIKPALEVFGIDVIRGDHRNETGQIDVDVIQLVQESDLCIADISLQNANVYYELGRRDESGKPLILLKSTSSQSLPVDIATRRYIEYNLDDRKSLISARDQIKDSIQSYVDAGMEKSKGTSLYAISEKIDRIERCLARLLDMQQETFSHPQIEDMSDDDPITGLKVAILHRNVPAAEHYMDILQYRLDELTFYDFVVEQVAALGSRKAGEKLIEHMDLFMDKQGDYHQKIEYLGYLIQYLNISNQESTYIEQVERTALRIKDEDNNIPPQVFNQLSRLYHGLFVIQNDESLLDKAISYIEKAISLSDNVAGPYYYNLAMCYQAKADLSTGLSATEYLNMACDSIGKAVELDGDDHDVDHLELACRLYHRMDDGKWHDYMDLLKKESPNHYTLLLNEFKQKK